MTLPTALVCPSLGATLVAQTQSSFTPLSVKEPMSQRCGTLLKLSMGQKPNTNSLSVSSQYFLLSPGCLVRNSPNVNPNHSQNSSTEQGNLGGSSLGNFLERLTVSQANRNLISGTEGGDIQENNDMETKVDEEELECGDEDFREPFLTLSESSGSPAPSLHEEDDTTETVTNRQVEDVEEQRQSQSQTSTSTRVNKGEKDGKIKKSKNIASPDPVTSKRSWPELQVRSTVLSTLILEPTRALKPKTSLISNYICCCFFP